MINLRQQQRLMLIAFSAVWFLLPFGRLSEVPIILLAFSGMVVTLKHRAQMSKQHWFMGLTVLSGLYFLLTFISALDSYWPYKSWLVSFASWRFYFMGVAVIWLANIKLAKPDRDCYTTHQISVFIFRFMALLAVFWCVDAIIQAIVGYDLFARPSYPGRLTGIFGDNVKLGPVLALMLPIVLMWGQQHSKWVRWFTFIVMLLAILLSGTRSAWLMMAFVCIMYTWQQLPRKRWGTLLKATLLVFGISFVLTLTVPEFKQRVDRSAELLSGQKSALDYALADRLPIWDNAWDMYKQHPINGVGARAFRKAYPEFAAEDDPWVQQNGVSLQAHHWVLELMAETGTLGFVFGLALIFIYSNVVKSQFKKATVWPYAVALIAAFLPVVSLYSLFSSFWSICLWWLVIVSLMGVSDD